MKTLLTTVLGLIIIGILANLITGAPSAKWNLVQPGMSQQQITTLLGRPSIDVLKSKGFQIWTRGRFIRIRSSGLVVDYNSQDNPDIATKVRKSEIWFWQAIGPPIMSAETGDGNDRTAHP